MASTADGVTWAISRPIPYPPSPGIPGGPSTGQLTAVAPASPGVAWAVGTTVGSGDHDNILKTTDGGLTWNRETNPGGPLLGVSAASETVAWAVGGRGTIYKTTGARTGYPVFMPAVVRRSGPGG